MSPSDGNRYRPACYATCVQDGSTFVVGQTWRINVSRSRVAAIVAIGGPILLAAMAGLGWVLAGAALRPVERLRAEAAALSLAEPARRLPVPETGDELATLAETLNGMLDRVHESLERERRLVDEASHELRTPLGVVQAELDLALREPRSREELEAALRSITQETDRLRRLTEDLLVLARSDRRAARPSHRRGRIGDPPARRSRVRRHSPRGPTWRSRSPARGPRASMRSGPAGGGEPRGERDPAWDRGGVVEVTSARDGMRSGSSCGCRPRVREDVLDPRSSRSRAPTGIGRRRSGLGLAIVRAVAEAHGGSAEVRNLDGGGAEVSIEMPV